jgi:hypothetical protein
MMPGLWVVPTWQVSEPVYYETAEACKLARIFHELPAATADMSVLPGVFGYSFDRLRTGSPCDVLFKYASDPIPCGCPVAHPSPRSRDTNS